ncbi:MAG: cysteine desulfurase [Planctomycetota bacterium]|nr:MAG: cysteine desulfurase [Planctomycetota bacterium]
MKTAAAAGYDVQRVRTDFPALHQQVHGHPLVYLDNAATAQKPRAVLDAMARFYERDCANIHRGVHALSQRATESYEAARRALAALLHAADPREIVFVRGATEAVNLVAQSYARPRLRPGDEVLITWMEHHSNIVPWQMLCEQTGATLRVAPIDDAGALIVPEFQRLLSTRTRIAAFAHVSNALGTINPVRALVDQAHAAGAKVLVDGAQAAPHLRPDVAALGCDFYCVSGHKMYGPTGSGVLWARAELLEAMPPYQGGGDMIRSVRFEKTTYNDLPFKFEAGTPNIAGGIGLGAAAEYLLRLGHEAITAHEQSLLARATAALQQVPGLRLIGTAPHKAAVISFTLDGVHPHDAGTILDQEGIAVRTGHHCAQPVMERFGVPATVRASFGLYNTPEEVDALVAGLHKVLEVFA